MRFKLTLERKPPRPELPISRGALTWLMFSLFITIGWHTWHIPEIPVWALVAVVPMSIFSYRRIIKEKPLPPPWLRITLTIAVVAGIILNYGFPLGRDPGITTLILLSSLKLMELKTRRDFMLIVFMCFFIIMGNFLYDQSLVDLTFMIAAVILVMAAVLRLNHPHNEPAKFSYLLKFSVRLFLLSLPLTVFLFLLFPRSPGAFLNIPRDSNIYESGFRDTLQPGDVAELAQSKATAFKVEFPHHDMPVQKDLYFRGLLLWFTDGKGWYQGQIPSKANFDRDLEGEGILQNITLEPHHKRWLFALDKPVAYPFSQVYPDNIFQAMWDVTSPMQYGVLSRPDAGMNFIPKVHRKWALQLPEDTSPRIMALARQWRDNSTGDTDILRQAEKFFKQGRFSYTLTPGQMDPRDPLGDFLFKRRQGFCEHFAASFALLMRAAGIPAKVVVGYQGGEFNPVGQFLEVRQSDAHAWAEVWLEQEGVNAWQRIDPTSWVAPERIQYGMEMSQTLAADNTDRDEALQDALRGNFFKRTWKFFKNHWENIKYKWDTWIITYDSWTQRNFLRSLGLGRFAVGWGNRMTFRLVLIILIPLLIFVISIFLRRRARAVDPLVRFYTRFCQKMAKAGLPRFQWEGPLHFGQRAEGKFPQKAQLIHQVTDLFVHLRYGRETVTKERLKQLRQSIRKI